MIDTYKNRGLREKLVKSLESKGIHDQAVLEALRSVPRHYFVESAFADSAYEDRALPIEEGQTISQPFTVAYQTQALELKPKMKVLEIGTGSGYQAAILCELGVKLFSVERIRGLYNRARDILHDLGYNPRLKWGDGTAGWEAHAPYDRIIVTAGAPVVPEALKKQLSVGGRMIIPVGNMDTQAMVLVIRKSKDEFEIRELDQFKFVPLIGKFGWKE